MVSGFSHTLLGLGGFGWGGSEQVKQAPRGRVQAPKPPTAHKLMFNDGGGHDTIIDRLMNGHRSNGGWALNLVGG